MNLYTVRAYSAAIRTGTKYTYQTIPRLLTLWLDMGEDSTLYQSETFKSINSEVDHAIESTPVYMVSHESNLQFLLLNSDHSGSLHFPKLFLELNTKTRKHTMFYLSLSSQS